MAHRQGLDDSSTNIHGGAVRVGRVLEGALARAAVRNGEVVDLHADAGAVLLAKRSVQIAQRRRSQILAKPGQVGAEQRTRILRLKSCLSLKVFSLACTAPKIFLTHEPAIADN